MAEPDTMPPAAIAIPVIVPPPEPIDPPAHAGDLDAVTSELYAARDAFGLACTKLQSAEIERADAAQVQRDARLRLERAERAALAALFERRPRA